MPPLVRAGDFSCLAFFSWGWEATYDLCWLKWGCLPRDLFFLSAMGRSESTKTRFSSPADRPLRAIKGTSDGANSALRLDMDGCLQGSKCVRKVRLFWGCLFKMPKNNGIKIIQWIFQRWEYIIYYKIDTHRTNEKLVHEELWMTTKSVVSIWRTVDDNQICGTSFLLHFRVHVEQAVYVITYPCDVFFLPLNKDIS